jgi:hypothetical protein
VGGGGEGVCESRGRGRKEKREQVDSERIQIKREKGEKRRGP